jgi:hypothetical protein
MSHESVEIGQAAPVERHRYRDPNPGFQVGCHLPFALE